MHFKKVILLLCEYSLYTNFNICETEAYSVICIVRFKFDDS